MTKQTKVVKHKEEFAKSILPLLKETNFHEIIKTNKEGDFNAVHFQFKRDGYHYFTSKSNYNYKPCKKGQKTNEVDDKIMVEIIRRNQPVPSTGYADILIEFCYVYLMDYHHKNTIRDFIIDKYYIHHYGRCIDKQYKCLFCNWKKEGKQLKNINNHIKTKIHMENRQIFLNDFVEMTRLNNDVVHHILSFLCC